MLYLENDEVKITDEGMMFPEVKELYKKDRRNESKPFFKKCITYIFWAYKEDGELRMLLPKKRRLKAADLAGVAENDMENDNKILDVIKLYKDLQKTPSQHLLDAAIKRVEETIEWLNSIPIKKIEKQKVKVSYSVPGKDEVETQYIPVEVEIDNSDEVKKGMQMANMLADQIDTLKKKIIKENTQQRKSTRLFDN